MLTPTITFQTEIGSIIVKTSLYGLVTPERLAHERNVARHRAEQLQPPKPRKTLIPDDAFEARMWDELERLNNG